MNNSKISIVPVGGRIKSAALGLDYFGTTHDPVEISRIIDGLRKKPSIELQKAFFPHPEVKQLVHGVGMYRPVLKTDQGMPGNFLPFSISSQPDTETANIIGEEGIAIPENHAGLDIAIISEIQSHFHDFRLKEVFDMIQSLSETQRKAEKGRGAFFFIRAAETNHPINLSHSTVKKVEAQVDLLLEKISAMAQDAEADFKRTHNLPATPYSGDNLLYCQPDVFVLNDGIIEIEKINCPDVGFFLTEITAPTSKIFADVKEINGQLGQAVIRTIIDQVDTKNLYILTRDEVLNDDEDVLEINEIRALDRLFGESGITIKTASPSSVDKLGKGSTILLLNIDYHHPSVQKLLERQARGEINCYPNPFFQLAASQSTGLKTQTLSGKPLKMFLELSASNPKNDQARRDIHRRISGYLHPETPTILHAEIDDKIVPVTTLALHSMRQIGNRLNGSAQQVVLRHLPGNNQNLKLHSSTGPRLHTFRFMAINKQ